MEVREKLVELIEKASHECDDFYDLWDMRQCADEIALFLLANGVTVQEWISVKDRLPEETGKYIVCTAKGTVYCTKFYTKRFGTDSNTHITHWMPLPQPPKGE